MTLQFLGKFVEGSSLEDEICKLFPVLEDKLIEMIEYVLHLDVNFPAPIGKTDELATAVLLVMDDMEKGLLETDFANDIVHWAANLSE